jgi:hypothetical protein
LLEINDNTKSIQSRVNGATAKVMTGLVTLFRAGLEFGRTTWDTEHRIVDEQQVEPDVTLERAKTEKSN